MEMEFSKSEIVFYGIAFVVSGTCSLARIWRDNEPIRSRVVVGRCISSGFFGAGGVALWIGRYPDSAGSGAFYFLAIAALIGYMSKDVQDQILTRLARWITNKIGPEDGPKNGGGSQQGT